MLLYCLRSVRGFVSFEISGRYPERFINITARNGVRLWDVRRAGEGFTACMYSSDYRAVRRLARSSGVRLRIKKKYGFPAFAARYSDRVGVVIGACVFVVTVFVMSMFIWSVDITGLETVSLSEMNELLRGEGICVGAFKPSLDYKNAAGQIMIKKKEIGWMAINVTGSYASVEVKEETPAPEVEDIYSPCNVKAERDGRILSMDTSEGDAVITEGSGVIAGQLLVSGVMVGEQGGQRFVHAKAKVMAQTERRAEFSVKDSFTVLKRGGETVRRCSLQAFGLSLPCGFGAVGSPYSIRSGRAESPAPLGVVLPVGTETEIVSSLEPESLTLDDDSAKELLIKRAELYESFVLNGCRVIGRDYRLSRRGGVYTLEAVFSCVEDIAISVPIEVEESPSKE